MTVWNNICLTAMDLLLGWALRLSWMVALVIVALLTGLLLVLTRRWFADQDLLSRVASDRKRIRELIAEAKAAKDKEALTRLKTLQGAVGMRAISQELKPLLAVVLPVAVLATWGYARLAHIPPRGGQPVEVRCYLPVSAVGQLAHIVPVEGLVSEPGWIVEVEAGEYAGQATGIAAWTLRGKERDESYALVCVCAGRSYAGEILIGHWKYSEPFRTFNGGEANLQLLMREARLAGIPGRPPLFPAWLVGYMLLAIPGSLVLKRLMRTN